MAGFADSAALETTDVVVAVAGSPAPALSVMASPALPVGETLARANLYAVLELVAGRAARASTARQYRSIYTRFANALRDELGRPPVVEDVTPDAIAAYSRELERHGGRGGGKASPATRRAHLTMLRALLKELGRGGDAAAVRVPSHRLGPPETLSMVEYGNLIRAPDRRTLIGKRDVAMLRLMGDCGLRNTELRELRARAIRRPRSNSVHHHLFVRGKGDVEREVPIPEETQAVLDAWLRVHPGRRGGGLGDEQPLFVRLTRDRSSGPISQQALGKILRRYAKAAGIPDRLAHPHALRGYYATTLVENRVPIQRIKARLGHASIETTARYLAELDSEPGDSVGEVLDRHHQRQRRDRGR